MYQPLFILCSGRSFSSVVCSMIGQHPDLYALPEMNFFVADTLAGVIDYFEERRSRYRLDGPVRCLAQLHEGEQTSEGIQRAWQWLEEHHAMPVQEFAQYIAQKVAPRQLVEKSPGNVADTFRLARLGEAFPEAKFLHLLRHPRAMGHSLYRVRSEKNKRKEQRRGQTLPPFDIRRIEENWLGSQHNILAFAKTLPIDRYRMLQGEWLLENPDPYLQQICQWLGLRDDEDAISEMKHPERSPYACVGPYNAPGGHNPGFLKDPVLRVSRQKPMNLMDSLEWTQNKSFFAPHTIELARQLGYT